MARIEAAAFAPTGGALGLDFKKQMLHRRGGAPADRQRHGLGEAKPVQAAAHRASAVPADLNHFEAP